jgi:long-chain fatty acid transport protein
MSLKFLFLAMAPLGGLFMGDALATDGYFDYGFGATAKGGGGAGVAFAQDGLAPATNPAGDAFISDQVNAGLTYFAPDRGASLGGTSYSADGTRAFYIPEAAWRQGIGQDVSIGIAAYGNGGLDTTYNKPLPGFAYGPGSPGPGTNTGIDLEQFFIAPTATFTFFKDHAVGVSAVIVYQRFKASGLENFGISDAGDDSSVGLGARFGYSGAITSWLSLGLTYQPRISTSRFTKYATLFADHGDFDIPGNFAGGIALRPLAGTTLAFDVERIQYDNIPAVGNQLTPATYGAGLGAPNGPGFGWKDVTAIKIGVIQRVGDQLTLRIGYNHSTQPIPTDQTLFNVLAPAVVQHHFTAGGSWSFSKSIDVTAYATYVPKQTVNGSGSPLGPNFNADLYMSQVIVGVGGAWNL